MNVLYPVICPTKDCIGIMLQQTFMKFSSGPFHLLSFGQTGFMFLCMTSELIINVAPWETRVALLENGTVVEFHVERAARPGYVGNIYKGRVVRVLQAKPSLLFQMIILKIYAPLKVD
jgi:hypothetical protein